MFLKWLDGNSDGIVTRDEVRMARPDKLDKPYGAGLVFDRLDTNKIGTLDKTRFAAVKKRLDWSRAAFQEFVLIGPLGLCGRCGPDAGSDGSGWNDVRTYPVFNSSLFRSSPSLTTELTTVVAGGRCRASRLLRLHRSGWLPGRGP